MAITATEALTGEDICTLPSDTSNSEVTRQIANALGVRTFSISVLLNGEPPANQPLYDGAKVEVVRHNVFRALVDELLNMGVPYWLLVTCHEKAEAMIQVVNFEERGVLASFGMRVDYRKYKPNRPNSEHLRPTIFHRGDGALQHVVSTYIEDMIARDGLSGLDYVPVEGPKPEHLEWLSDKKANPREWYEEEKEIAYWAGLIE